MSRPTTKHKRLKDVTIDEVTSYILKGCLVLPPLYDYYLDQLEELERQGKICLTPSCIFELYHRNLFRKLPEIRRVRKVA